MARRTSHSRSSSRVSSRGARKRASSRPSSRRVSSRVSVASRTHRSLRSRTATPTTSSILDAISPFSILVIGLFVVLIAISNSLFFDPEVVMASVRLPFSVPPNWILGPVWTGMYVIFTISFVLTWNARQPGRGLLAWLYVLHGMILVMWSMFFFGLRAASMAFVDSLVLWVSVWTIMLVGWRHSRLGAGLLIAYLAWVTLLVTMNGLILFVLSQSLVS